MWPTIPLRKTLLVTETAAGKALGTEILPLYSTEEVSAGPDITITNAI